MEKTMTYNLGRIGFGLRGLYNENETYEELDVVTYNGSSYAAKETCTGVVPGEDDRWLLQAQGYVVEQSEPWDIQSGSVGFTATKATYTDITVSFTRPYAEKPIVMLTPCTGSTSNDMGRHSCTILWDSLKTTGFKMRWYNGESGTTRSPRFYWVSIGRTTGSAS